jgi:hypothetical protein
MADTYLCAHCASTNLMHRMIDMQCLDCGHLTHRDGRALPVEPVFEGHNAHDRRPM